MKRTLLACLLLAALLAPAAARANETGPDYISSDNVTLVERLKTTGDGVGARIVGPYMYVTSTKSLDIYDIKTDPEHPQLVGLSTVDIEFENEEVPTNGKLLGISGEEGCRDPLVLLASIGCLDLWDVSDPASPKWIKSVEGAGDHTSTCVYDCSYIYGSYGHITDARNPAEAKLIGNWDDSTGGRNCHHVREIQPGVVLGSCQPIILFSARPQDGGSITDPVVIAKGTNADDRFIHSSQWPNNGTDRFMLAGGETNFSPSCDDTVGAFMVWDASDVRDGRGGFKPDGEFKLLSEVRPTNGTYADGHSPYNALGCSVHWFEQHPTFRDGGLVALAEYENGTHFLQITAQGKIVDQGFFLPLAGSTSAPHWNPYDPRIVYSVDYARGVDVLKYKGDTYVPAAAPSPGAVPGTEGGAAFQQAQEAKQQQAAQKKQAAAKKKKAAAKKRKKAKRKVTCKRVRRHGKTVKKCTKVKAKRHKVKRRH